MGPRIPVRVVQSNRPIWSINDAMRVTRPLVRLDPGWLFIAAGLVMVCAAVLIPPQRQLAEMRDQLGLLREHERVGVERLRAYAEFIERLEQGDPVLLRRLAAAQLNLAPAGDVPILAAGSAAAPVTEWIEATVPPVEFRPHDPVQSDLVELVTGEHRHWVLAGSIAALFIGLLLGPSGQTRSESVRIEAPDQALEHHPDTMRTNPAPASAVERLGPEPA